MKKGIQSLHHGTNIKKQNHFRRIKNNGYQPTLTQHIANPSLKSVTPTTISKMEYLLTVRLHEQHSSYQSIVGILISSQYSNATLTVGDSTRIATIYCRCGANAELNQYYHFVLKLCGYGDDCQLRCQHHTPLLDYNQLTYHYAKIIY